MKNRHITLDPSVPDYKLTKNERLKREMLSYIDNRRHRLKNKLAQLKFSDSELVQMIKIRGIIENEKKL